jgi:O-antigen biosynthesis protein
MFTLSIVIPTYNGRRHLERCLPAVCRYAPCGTQIIVVDDASNDDTVSWVQNNFHGVDLIALPANQGFVGAANAGIRQAHGDIVELLNNDTEVRAGWAEPCLHCFSDPTVGSVAPLVLRMDDPKVIDSAGMEYHACGWAYNRGFNRELNADYEASKEVFGAPASAGFYRRSAIEKVSGFLRELEAIFEDVDLAFRLRWAGYCCMFEPAARVLHQVSASYGQENARVTRLVSRNEELVYWTNLPLTKLLLGLVPHLGFLTIRLLRKLGSPHLLPFLTGKLEALASGRQIVDRRRKLGKLAQIGNVPANLYIACDQEILARGVNWLHRRQCA